MSFFWRYIFFFRYFIIMHICNCLWFILLWIFWNFCNSIRSFITNQFTSCFCCFLKNSFWRSFKCICCRLFSMIEMFRILSSSLEYWSVNHTSINVKSELKVFKNIKFLVKYLVTNQMTYWEETYTRLLNLDDNCC